MCVGKQSNAKLIILILIAILGVSAAMLINYFHIL
jgi:hypothetical protein